MHYLVKVENTTGMTIKWFGGSFMKRFAVICFVLSLPYMLFVQSVAASITKEDLDQFIEEVGLTNEELSNYLSFYNLSLTDFETMEELDNFLGTPINDENLYHLLASHDLSEEELHALLSGFGEHIDNYLFIEDLEVDVSFYLKHAEILHEAERLLSDIGLNEQEADRFFQHLMSLDKSTLEEDLSKISMSLEQYFSYDGATQITSSQKEEIMALFEEMLMALKLNSTYYLADGESRQATTLTELVEMNSLDGSELVVELTNEDNQLIMDMQLTEEALTADDLLGRGEQFISIASLANELSVAMVGESLPNTASPYSRNIIISICIILFGWWLYLRFAPSKNQS